MLASSIGSDCPLVPFWRGLARFAERTAVIDARTNSRWSYGCLLELAEAGAEKFDRGSKSVVLIQASRTVDFILIYLSALRAGHAIVLVDNSRSGAVEELTAAFSPDFVCLQAGTALGQGYVATPAKIGDYELYRSATPQATVPHEDLALVLRTSGSSGRPRCVRLSASNVAVNAVQVMRALAISEDDVAISVLPFSYVFGLSVLNSHLAAGATVVVARESVLEPKFWAHVERYGATSLSGVTLTYEMLRRAGLQNRDAGCLRKLCHAGGKISEGVASWLAAELTPRYDVYLMYGATEGAGRLAVLPPSLMTKMPRSVGHAVPGGKFSISEDGEVVYEGPNVMLGYASSRGDLERGDDCGGVLRTGDLGYLDEADRLYLTGRATRSVKVFGRRYVLDDVEFELSPDGDVVVVSNEDRLVAFCPESSLPTLRRRCPLVASKLGLPASALRVQAIESFPRTETGKIDYSRLSLHLRSWRDVAS